MTTENTETTDETPRRTLRRETRSLTCTLTREEIQYRGRQVGVKAGELREENASFEAAKEDHKARTKRLEEDITLLHGALETGTESRGVECEHVINEELTRVELIRSDSGEIVDYRPLTPEERKREMFRREGGKEEPAPGGTYTLKGGKGRRGKKGAAAEPEAVKA